MPKSSISFRVPPKLWSDFKEQTDKLFLSRAPFLDHMVANELPHLREDLQGVKLSSRTKRYIAGELKRRGPVSVNIEVRPSTAEALRNAIEKHNLVRDAFMCRLIIFLRCTKELRKLLELPSYASDRGLPGGLEEMPISPLEAMEAVRDDPLFYIRAHVEHYEGAGVYSVLLPKALDWAACYLPDERVRNTGAFKKAAKQQEKLNALMGLLPDAAPAKSKGGTK